MIACPECDAERSRQYDSPCPKCGYIIHKEHDETDQTIGDWGFALRFIILCAIALSPQYLGWYDWIGYIIMVVGGFYILLEHKESREASGLAKKENEEYLDELEQNLKDLKKAQKKDLKKAQKKDLKKAQKKTEDQS